jgi:rhodanese-related sulfurtransferase
MTTSTLPPLHRLTPAEVHHAQENALLLDVRTPAEFESEHIAGSTLHPLDQLDCSAVQKLASEKSACVLVCRSGNRAKQAAEKLAAHGVENLQLLEGGVLAWESAGLPLKRGHKTMSLERQVRIAAGTLVSLGVLFGWFVNPLFTLLSGFVGAGLVFAGITDTCGMGMLLAKMPWNQRRG